MKNYDYIIIGGGMAGSSAVMGIRKNDPSGTIAIFTDEPYPPYNRPPLSKGLWGKMIITDIMRPMEKYQIDVIKEKKIVSIDAEKKTILDNDNFKYAYAKLLIATGGSPIRLPNAPKEVLTYRTLDDFKILKATVENHDRVCVVGGGFIGTEIAASLSQNNKNVTLVFPEMGLANQIFPEDVSLFLNGYYEDRGITIRSKQLVQRITKETDEFIVQMKHINSGKTDTQPFDSVILGIGIKSNDQLARKAGLAVEDGIIVNEFLQTNSPDIFAAGDVANFYHAGLKKRMRAEHEDNANQMGMAAGLNMSGKLTPYTHFPFFYSDLFDLGYEAIGEFHSSFQILEDWIEPFQKGTLFYLNEGQLRGIIFWNLWGKLDQGRELITNGRSFTTSELIGQFS